MFPASEVQSALEFEEWMLWSKEPRLQDFFSQFLSDADDEKTTGTLPSDVVEWISEEILRQDPAARGWGYRIDREASIPGMFHCHVFVHRPGFAEKRARIREALHRDSWHKVDFSQKKRMKSAVHAVDAVHFMGSKSEANEDFGFGVLDVPQETAEIEVPFRSIEDLPDFMMLRRSDFLNVSASEAQQILEECTTEGTTEANRTMICALPDSAVRIIEVVTSACTPNKMYIEDCWGQCLG